ncbi:MAG: zinc-dependent metalloprotease [Actinomycetes bacterium]
MSAATPLLDRRIALATARLVAPTRRTDPAEVARLRADVLADLPAIDAAARRWSGLGADLPATTCTVLGRVGWVRANLAVLDGAFDPLAEKLRGDRRVAARVLGVQLGALFGLLSTKVLGQFVLPLAGPGSGRLVVVGPNLLDLADEHGGLAGDIRRTVLLHEVVHRLQFDAVGWLGDHLRGLLTRYLEHARVDPGALLDAAGRLPEAVARARETGSVQPIVESVLTPEQAEVVAEAQGLMSLLEGHGNAAMFTGGGDVVDDPDAVRDALASRREDVTTRVLTAVAGLELKRRQYAHGEAFVRAVVDRGGVATLNRAWDAPGNLPTVEEIDAPDAWVARVTAG